MTKMTRKEATSKHRKMWRWIARETKKRKRVVDKRDYFDEMKIPDDEIPINQCYCCHYAVGWLNKLGLDKDLRRMHDQRCRYCLVHWGTEGAGLDCYCMGRGLFCTWLRAVETNNWEIAAVAARQIAGLPERETLSL